MPIKRIILLAVLVLLSGLIILSFTALNVGSTEISSDSFLSTAHANEDGPENWIRLGLQLSHTPSDEETALKFMEKAAAHLQDKGIAEVVILPALIDLTVMGEELDGVFLFHFDLESDGWYISRQGNVVVTAEFIPLHGGALQSMSTGITAYATGRGWFNRAYFAQKMIEEAAGLWVSEAAKGLNIADIGLPSVSEIRYLDSNLTAIPADLSGLVTTDSQLMVYFAQGNDFAMNYLTTDPNLESILESELTEQWDMDITVPWMDASGGRRTIQAISEDRTEEIRVYYSYAAHLPRAGGIERPFYYDRDLGHFLVTIIAVTNEIK